MTEQKHLKALIRARMARTGESYTAARRHFVKPDARPNLTPTAAFRAHDKHCMTAVFTPDDAHIISGGFGGQARIWTLDGSLTGELVGHEAAVSVCGSPQTVGPLSPPRRTRPSASGISRSGGNGLSSVGTGSRCWRSTSTRRGTACGVGATMGS